VNARPLVIAGGPIVTMAAPGSVEAVAVRGDRIAWAGSLEECRARAGPDREERDLGGRVLMPGFVDPHIHPLMLGQTSAWVDVGPEDAPSIDAMVELLRRRAASQPPGEPVHGYGYDLRRIAERRHPTSAELDRVAPDREVFVMHASGHGGVVNSVALAGAGIDARTPDVPGGEVGRAPDGTPDGLLMDAAWDLLAGPEGVRTGRHGPNIHHAEPPDALLRHLSGAQAAILRAGITTVADAQVTRRETETWLALRDAGRLRLRVHLYLLSSLLDEVLALGLVGSLGDDRLRIAGIKLYADGTLVGRTAWFPDGYAGDPAERGLLYHEPSAFTALLVRAHTAGLQTATHALSPAAIGLVVDAVEQAVRVRPRPDVRHRIEHCALPTVEDVARMADLGIVPVAQSQHALAYGDGAIAAVGEELGQRYHPLGLYARAGVRFALSSDAPVAPPDPLRAVQAAVERRTVLGTVLGPDELRVDAGLALRACTIDAAWACHAERSVGSIAPGKLADFVVLSADPTSVPTGAIASIRVEETWLAGEVVP
jgi:hypothetical protein